MRGQTVWGLGAGLLAAIAVPLTAVAAPADPAVPVPRSEPSVVVAEVRPPSPLAATDCDAGAATGAPAGATGDAPSVVSAQGVLGTSTADIAAFAVSYNAWRVAACLPPIPLANFRYDACMEARLFWIAEDPSPDPTSAWGHIGTERSDGLPSVGCDGNLAGGMNNTAATVARKWWDSEPHRTALYRPSYTGSTADACIYVAMTHGGVPDEPVAFVRAAARWAAC